MNRYLSIFSLIPVFVIYLFIVSNYDCSNSIEQGVKLFLTTEHSLISIPEKTGNLYYHIEPYREVRFTLKNGLTWRFASYNSTISKNNSVTTLSFVDNYPENKDNLDCYDNQMANTFNLNIVCDPLIKYYVGDVIQNDECSYEANLFTELGCPWLYSNKYEL